MNLCVLFDVDLFIKLACCDLWHSVLKLFKIAQPYRLPSATGQSCQKKIRRQMGESAPILGLLGDRIEEMVQRTPIVPVSWVTVAEANELYRRLREDSGIDASEALLTTVVLTVPEAAACRLATGDKRFIGAMQERFPAEFAQLKPRIISLEGCVLRVIDAYGIEETRRLMGDGLVCDTALRVAFQGDPGKSVVILILCDG